MANFGPITAENCRRVWGTQQISTAFASWQPYCTAFSSGRQPNFAALNRGRHLYSAGRPSRWALAHISSSVKHSLLTALTTQKLLTIYVNQKKLMVKLQALSITGDLLKWIKYFLGDRYQSKRLGHWTMLF